MSSSLNTDIQYGLKNVTISYWCLSIVDIHHVTVSYYSNHVCNRPRIPLSNHFQCNEKTHQAQLPPMDNAIHRLEWHLTSLFITVSHTYFIVSVHCNCCLFFIKTLFSTFPTQLFRVYLNMFNLITSLLYIYFFASFLLLVRALHYKLWSI